MRYTIALKRTEQGWQAIVIDNSPEEEHHSFVLYESAEFHASPRDAFEEAIAWAMSEKLEIDVLPPDPSKH